MLVHICCSVDSHFFLEKLKKDFPEEKLIGFFYDPNIHPYSEYRLRYMDVKRSCNRLGIELLEGEYDFESWMDLVRGLEHEPEKGARCEVCFDRRFEVSARKALELGEKKITTTLLVSPLKSQEQLKRVGDAFYQKNGVEFVAVDYRSGGGTQDQARVTKEEQLYRQDYCGCIYGLSQQRAGQNQLMDEMLSPIDGRILPASIEERLELYAYRMELEEEGVPYRIVKEKFLNYRLFSATLYVDKAFVWAHVLPYSILSKKRAKGRVEAALEPLFYLNRDEVIFMTLKEYNAGMKSSFQSIQDLVFNPPSFDKEVALRHELLGAYDLSAVLVVDSIPEGKVELRLDAKVYEDKRERLKLL